MHSKPAAKWLFRVGGLLLGIALGVVVDRYFLRIPPRATVSLDFNKDGIPDFRAKYQDGFVRDARHDRDFDGKWDFYEWFDDEGKIQRTESDDNFNGRMDSWISFSLGMVSRVIQDVDDNGQADVVWQYEHGVIQSSLWQPNGETKFVRAEDYGAGFAIRREYRDTDGDGLLEVLISYNDYGAPIREEALDPPMAVKDLKLDSR